MRPLRVGLVCPYALEIPGGVQNHVRDLAEALIERGHDVSVLAPAESDEGLPAYVVPAGKAVPVSYNGSVARVLFGPVAYGRVRRWLAEGDFDVVHIHEPGAPSVGLLALSAADCPVVGTFHISHRRSRVMSASAGLLRPRLERLDARIAVSELARDTLVQHIGGEPVVIPNGLWVDRFADAPPLPDLPDGVPVLAFVGRLDEPRKGFDLLLEAVRRLDRRVEVLVVGHGAAEEDLPPGVRMLGPVDDAEKARVLASADVYVAPHRGGESFGIVLAEAMAAGACVLASDLPAFGHVLAQGEAGELFTTGDVDALVAGLRGLLDDPERRRGLAQRAADEVRRYDWSRVTTQVLDVYETVVRR